MKREEWNVSEGQGLKDGRIISLSACMCDG